MATREGGAMSLRVCCASSESREIGSFAGVVLLLAELVPADGFAANPVAAVEDHRAGFEVCDGGELHAPRPVEAKVDGTGFTATDDFSLG